MIARQAFYHLSFSYFFEQGLKIFAWHHPQTTVLSMPPEHSWDKSCTSPHLACWLRWHLTSFSAQLPLNHNP
jgi:hypothetical protein